MEDKKGEVRKRKDKKEDKKNRDNMKDKKEVIK